MKKILFVDDDFVYLKFLKRNLEAYNAQFYLTGAEALTRINQQTYDFIFLDMNMFLDGVMIVNLGNGRLKDSKVYIITGDDEASLRLRDKIESIKDKIAGVLFKDNPHVINQIKQILGEPPKWDGIERRKDGK